MKFIRCLTIVLFFGAYPRHVHGQTAPSERVPDKNAVSEALTKVRNLKTTSAQHFLKRASVIFPPVCVGLAWDDVTAVVERQKCPIVHSQDNGDSLQRYYLLRRKAVTRPNGQSLDAYVWLSGRNADGSGRPTRPEKISQARIVLGDEIDAGYAETPNRYADGSVFDVVYRSKEVRQAGARWPLVKNLFVHYGSFISRDGVSHGFHATVELTASLDKKIGGKRLYFFIPSGPVKPTDGELPGDPAPTVKLSAPYAYGGNEWWHGEREVVERNQKLYLKPTR